MRNRFFALGFALLLTFTQAAPAFAATPRALDDWSALQTLSAGQRLVIRTKDGDRLTGRFDSVSDLLLNYVEDNGRKVSLRRESIKVVQLNRGKSRGKAALLGAVIGGGAGLALGGWAYAQDDFNAAIVYAPGALGAGIGAGIGAALGKGNKNETVYEAP
ncbi:MAG: LSm family protein [Pyrinomonadaceae bacterium]